MIALSSQWAVPSSPFADNGQLSTDLFFRYTCRTVMSAGVMPPMREAWPSVAGWKAVSFSLASARRCAMAV